MNTDRAVGSGAFTRSTAAVPTRCPTDEAPGGGSAAPRQGPAGTIGDVAAEDGLLTPAPACSSSTDLKGWMGISRLLGCGACRSSIGLR